MGIGGTTMMGLGVEIYFPFHLPAHCMVASLLKLALDLGL